MKKLPRLTIAEHVALGNAFKAARHAQSKVLYAFIKSSPAAKAAMRAIKAHSALTSALDDDVCGLVPRERDPRALATRVYYGKPFVENAQHSDPNDAFAGWEAAES